MGMRNGNPNIKEQQAPQLASMNQGTAVAVVQVWAHDDFGFGQEENIRLERLLGRRLCVVRMRGLQIYNAICR